MMRRRAEQSSCNISEQIASQIALHEFIFPRRNLSFLLAVRVTVTESVFAC